MDRALWLLIKLRLKGWWRFIKRSVTTVKGAVSALVAVGLFGLWMTGVVIQGLQAPRNLDLTRLYGPLALFGLCLLNLTMSVGERVLSFSPAEVNLLFTAPLSRRQLLLYKIVMIVGAGSISGLFMAILLRPQTSGFLQALVASLMFFQFFQLFLMVLALSASAIGEGRFRRQKIIGLVILGLAVGVVLWQQGAELFERDFREILEALVANPLLNALLLPFRWMVNIAVSESYLEMLGWTAATLPFNILLLFTVFALDKYYLEAAASASEKRFAQRQKLRGGAFAVASLQRKGKPLYTLPSFPRLSGLGPMVWRQMVIGLRGPAWLATLAIIGASMFVPILLQVGEENSKVPVSAVFGIGFFFMTILIAPTTMTFDFRGDIDRMEPLKTLPLPRITIVCGQILAPVLLLSLVQMLFLGILQIVESEPRPWWLIGFPFVVSLNFLVFALHNLFFLWIPTRQVAQGPGDIQTMVRQTLVWLSTIFVLGLLLVVVSLVGVLTYFLLWKSLIATGLAVYVVTTGFAFAIVPLLCLAFNQYDVARDTPPE
ncbi:MAG: putative ABC exporter domain-containing protein [Gemmataceae bacterium]